MAEASKMGACAQCRTGCSDCFVHAVVALLTCFHDVVLGVRNCFPRRAASDLL